MNTLLARLWHQIGLMYRFIGIRSGQKDAFLNAERAFSRALDYLPGYQLARYNRALLYWRELQAAEKAVTDLTPLAEEDYKDAHFIRAMAHQALGNYHAAVADLEAFLVRHPFGRSSNNAISQLNALYAIVDDMPPGIESSSPDKHENL